MPSLPRTPWPLRCSFPPSRVWVVAGPLVLLAACGGDDAAAPSTTNGPDATAALDATSQNNPTSDGSSTVVPSLEAGGEASPGRDAESESLADASLPPLKSPFDWVGVVGTGQSLSIGATAQNMSKTQPFKNLKLVDTGPDPKYPIAANTGTPQWATTPLIEPIRSNSAGMGAGYNDGQYPNNMSGESPHSGMANTLSAFWTARGGVGDYVTAHSVVGWSGHCLSDINKDGGKRAYPATLNEALVWKDLAAKATKTFGYGGIILTHGECDAGNAGYGAGLYKLWQDYNTDLKAITGQMQDIVLLISQQSTISSGAGGSAVQVWQAGVAHPGQIVCTGPKYQYQYSGDNLHFPAPGYERLGQKYAEVFDRIVNQKASWKPLQPNKISRAGAKITIDFDVPNPPLVWDAHIPPPHQAMNTEWAGGKGFEVKSAGGARLQITDAVIQGSSVVITLAADPGAGKVNVAYAITQEGTGNQGGTPLGMRGLLRDSDEFVGYDPEMLEGQMTQGSAAVASTAAGAFVRRAGRDIVTGTGVPADTIVTTHDSDDKLTLSAPWPNASGKVMLSYRHDERNYCVHFAMNEP
jgi:hypothetical protein